MWVPTTARHGHLTLCRIRSWISYVREARYARERYDLYRARTYGSRPVSESRMRELERICAGAEARLRKAEADAQRACAAGEPPAGES